MVPLTQVEWKFCYRLQTSLAHHILNASWHSLHEVLYFFVAYFPYCSIPKMIMNRLMVNIPEIDPFFKSINSHKFSSFQDRPSVRYAWCDNWLHNLGFSVFDAFVSFEQFHCESDLSFSMFDSSLELKSTPIHHRLFPDSDTATTEPENQNHPSDLC